MVKAAGSYDLEARARWHLEIGYPEAEDLADQAGDFDELDGRYDERPECWSCGGEGFEVTCCDDLCHGQGFCMHGDGQRTCPVCHGRGVL